MIMTEREKRLISYALTFLKFNYNNDDLDEFCDCDQLGADDKFEAELTALSENIYE